MCSERSRQSHSQYQRQYFDRNVDFFRQPIPEDVSRRTQEIVAAARLTETSRVMDVGTGIGVLIGHITRGGVPERNVLAIDLSANMLAEAGRRYPGCDFWQGDVAEIPLNKGPFDAVFFNACFGNIIDPFAVLQRVKKVLASGGRIVISHPLGKAFVEQLHHYEPELVPHLLPVRDTLDTWAKQLGLSLVEFRDEGKLYLAVLRAPEESPDQSGTISDIITGGG